MANLSVKGLKRGKVTIKCSHADVSATVEVEVVDQTIVMPMVALVAGESGTYNIDYLHPADGGSTFVEIVNDPDGGVEVISFSERQVTLFCHKVVTGTKLKIGWLYNGLLYTNEAPIVTKEPEIPESPISVGIAPQIAMGAVGESINLSITITPEGSKFQRMDWTVIPADLATVTPGKITINKVGEGTASCTVTDMSGLKTVTNMIAVKGYAAAVAPSKIEILTRMNPAKAETQSLPWMGIWGFLRRYEIEVKLTKPTTELPMNYGMKFSERNLEIVSLTSVSEGKVTLVVQAIGPHSGRCSLLSTADESIKYDFFLHIASDAVRVQGVSGPLEPGKSLRMGVVYPREYKTKGFEPTTVAIKAYPTSELISSYLVVSQSLMVNYIGNFPTKTVKYLEISTTWPTGEITKRYHFLCFLNPSLAESPLLSVSPTTFDVPTDGDKLFHVNFKFNTSVAGSKVLVHTGFGDRPPKPEMTWQDETTVKADGTLAKTSFTLNPDSYSGLVFRVEKDAGWYDYMIDGLVRR